MTFSQSDFYKVNETVFKPLLLDFSKVERVLWTGRCPFFKSLQNPFRKNLHFDTLFRNF